jgi:hypothetical protein
VAGELSSDKASMIVGAAGDEVVDEEPEQLTIA